MTRASRHILPEKRRPLLRMALSSGRALRFMEAHTPLSAMIATAAATVSNHGKTERFDGLWISGFSIATSRALPDAELARLERRLETIDEIVAATHLPLIVDADTGGEAGAFARLCARLETLGVSAVVIEDKAFPKRTSLATGVDHHLEDMNVFLAKIAAAKAVLRSRDFMIFGRIEALIAECGMDEAMHRARALLSSQADGVLIHSKDKCGAEIMDFADRYRTLQSELGVTKPLIVIPTAYPQFREDALYGVGASIVIYGNHQIRAAHAAMTQVCANILHHGRALEAEGDISTVAQLIAEIGAES